MIEHFWFKKVITGRAFHGEASVELIFNSSSSGLSISFGKNEENWKYAIGFACDYFFKFIPPKMGGVEIKIISLTARPGTSNTLTVFYTVYMAIRKASQLDDLPVIKWDENGNLCLPRK